LSPRGRSARLWPAVIPAGCLSGAPARATPGPRAARQPPDGLGSALAGLAAAGPDRRLRPPGAPRARLAGAHPPNPEPSRPGPGPPGGAAVPAADREGPRPDPPRPAAAVGCGAGLARATPPVAGTLGEPSASDALDRRGLLTPVYAVRDLIRDLVFWRGKRYSGLNRIETLRNTL